MKKSRKLLTGASIAILAIIVVGGGYYAHLHSTNASASTPTPTPLASSSTSSTPAVKTSGAPSSSKPTVSSAQNTPLLNNAVITQISSPTFDVAVNRTSYQVNTASSTKFELSNGSLMSIGDLNVNDLINIYGAWANSSHTIVNATTIMDLSTQDASFTGTITSMDLANNRFTMVTFNGQEITVTVTPSTNITDKNGNLTYLPNVNTGDTISVTGLWDIQNASLTQIALLTDHNITA